MSGQAPGWRVGRRPVVGVWQPWSGVEIEMAFGPKSNSKVRVTLSIRNGHGQGQGQGHDHAVCPVRPVPFHAEARNHAHARRDEFEFPKARPSVAYSPRDDVLGSGWDFVLRP